ncbi:MAG: hypothetical protein M1834_000439 [Cirrosporium novae-zelandiae]|nr:MAG: hypothetical protein M1834_000439 [Cirrosporium novae-zelandiae]
MFISALIICLYVASVVAAPPRMGISFDKRDDMPTLTLPYGTWKASSYNSNGKLYTFKNIRFGAAPVGDLRWAKPATPEYNDTIQDGSYGPACLQSQPNGLNLLGSLNESPIGGVLNEFLGGIPLPTSLHPTSEDCLFLDIVVPAKALSNSSSNLPVIVWFYGGAFMFGAKDAYEPILPFYDGTGLIQESGEEVIWVAANYRLGALGWLAGSTMEEDGLPNAGLYDQRAALQWVQDYISLLGGDSTQVSAWGESAGAASILHHLVAYGGTQDPLFSRAVLQSPAYEFMWDRRGTMEEVFQNFSSLAGCEGQGLTCLRSASSDTIKEANIQLAENTPDGTFSIGPSTDGDLIRQLAVLEYASGNYYQGLESIILSHTSNEPNLFVDGHVQTDAEFTEFLDTVFPKYTRDAGVVSVVEEQYPSSSYDTVTDRVLDFLGDSCFHCNTRWMTDALASVSDVYNLLYAVTPGYHATDILPTFYNLNLDIDTFAGEVAFALLPLFGTYAQGYQSYLTSHARTGNPNTYRKILNIPTAIKWPTVGNVNGEKLTGVLKAGNLGFSTTSDSETTESACGFWREIAAAVTNLGGYAPPGSVVNQTLITVTNNPSGAGSLLTFSSSALVSVDDRPIQSMMPLVAPVNAKTHNPYQFPGIVPVRPPLQHGTYPDPTRLAPEDALDAHSPPRRTRTIEPLDTSRTDHSHLQNGAGGLRVPSTSRGRKSGRSASRRRRAVWKKLLWVKQSYPDNYTDEETFLDHLQRNPRIQPYDFWPLVADSTVIVQHICSVAIFVSCFVGIYQERISPVSVVGWSNVATVLGWMIWDNWVSQEEKREERRRASVAFAENEDGLSTSSSNSNDNTLSKDPAQANGLGLSLSTPNFATASRLSHSHSTSAASLYSNSSFNSPTDHNLPPIAYPPASQLSSRTQQRLATAKSAVLIYSALLMLSPILKSLTRSTSSDSIWAMSTWLISINVFCFDYGGSNPPPSSSSPYAQNLDNIRNKNTGQFPASLSTNAALMASTVLASRLPSTTHVFSLTLFSIEVFGLFPVFRRHLRWRSWTLHLLLTILLILCAGGALGMVIAGPESGWKAALLGMVIGGLGTSLAMGGCSWWLIGLQKYKNVVIGPWDPARPVIRRKWD